MKLQSVKTAEQLLKSGGLLYRGKSGLVCHGITGLALHEKSGLVCADFLGSSLIIGFTYY